MKKVIPHLSKEFQLVETVISMRATTLTLTLALALVLTLALLLNLNLKPLMKMMKSLTKGKPYLK